MLDFALENESSWERIRNSGVPAVIYGMGNGADKVIDEFNRIGVTILGVTASDDFVRGQSFRGFKVKKLSEFSGDFIVAVAFASGLPQVMEHIYSLPGEVIVPCVPVFGNEIFNRSFIQAHEDEINAAYRLFDDSSKKVFASCVNFMFAGKLNTLRGVTSEKDEVFGSFFSMGDNESYLDLGAYRGDTVEEFLRSCNNKYDTITAVEPDKKTFRKLADYLSDIPNSTAICKAVGNGGKARFNSLAGRQSALSETGDEIDCMSIDELCEGRRVTYIKMDIEGAELAAINGAEKTLADKKPKLNIALYHRSEDIFTLPLKIAQINPEYKFYLRRHPYIPCWDMNIYCV